MYSGTLKERGMIIWQGGDEEGDQELEYEEGREVYDIPILSKFLMKYRIAAYIPFLPTYKQSIGKKS